MSEVASPKTQIEDLREQSAQAQRDLACAQAQTSTLIHERSILSVKLEFPPPSASVT